MLHRLGECRLSINYYSLQYFNYSLTPYALHCTLFVLPSNTPEARRRYSVCSAIYSLCSLHCIELIRWRIFKYSLCEAYRLRFTRHVLKSHRALSLLPQQIFFRPPWPHTFLQCKTQEPQKAGKWSFYSSVVWQSASYKSLFYNSFQFPIYNSTLS